MATTFPFLLSSIPFLSNVAVVPRSVVAPIEIRLAHKSGKKTLCNTPSFHSLFTLVLMATVPIPAAYNASLFFPTPFIARSPCLIGVVV